MGRSISSIENDIKNASARVSIAEQSGDLIQIRNARSDLEKYKAELISANTQALIDAQNVPVTKAPRSISSIENDIKNASARVSIAEQSGDLIQIRNARSDLEKYKAELISANTQAIIDAQKAQNNKGGSIKTQKNNVADSHYQSAELRRVNNRIKAYEDETRRQMDLLEEELKNARVSRSQLEALIEDDKNREIRLQRKKEEREKKEAKKIENLIQERAKYCSGLTDEELKKLTEEIYSTKMVDIIDTLTKYEELSLRINDERNRIFEEQQAVKRALKNNFTGWDDSTLRSFESMLKKWLSQGKTDSFEEFVSHCSISHAKAVREELRKLEDSHISLLLSKKKTARANELKEEWGYILSYGELVSQLFLWPEKRQKTLEEFTKNNQLENKKRIYEEAKWKADFAKEELKKRGILI